MRRPLVAAHRGGALLWPENSLRAFRESLALGVDLLELDVHLAADGRVVVIHDPSLDRTTSGQGPVVVRTSTELAAVRLRGPDGVVTDEHLPTLDQALALMAPSSAGLLMEIKGPTTGAAATYERAGGTVRTVSGAFYPGLVEAALASVRRAGMLGRVNVMSFHPGDPPRARVAAPAVGTTMLIAARQVAAVDASAEEVVGWAVEVGATDLGLQHTALTPAVVTVARRAGVRIGAWTVNDEAAMRRMIDLDVDVLTTDRPDLALQVLGRCGG